MVVATTLRHSVTTGSFRYIRTRFLGARTARNNSVCDRLGPNAEAIDLVSGWPMRLTFLKENGWDEVDIFRRFELNFC